MSLTSFLSLWKSDSSIAPNISAWQVFPKRDPVYVDFPLNLDQRLKSHLLSQDIRSLYLHQYQAWQEIQSGNNFALVTGTASGKTLSYTLPVLHNLLENDSYRALFLYPTKALAHDQLGALNAFSAVTAAAYDGDTPSSQRAVIRSSSQIIISNPDMLHLGILPYHTHWEDFFSRLQYVVLDEMHTYRGVFGSHVANVIRRLKRVANHYGSSPQFLLTSATIGNPLAHAKTLIEEKVQLINKDYSSRGEKHFLIFNPPVIDEILGLRAGMQRESVRLASEIINAGYQTILFGRSRKSVEFMLTKLREKCSIPPDFIRAYRSGYLPLQRREIEAGLRSGQVRAVAATTALELGIDIGGLDAVIIAGYPGSIAGAWQQAGRSGRADNPSLSILVASSNPLDQYLALYPEYLFNSNPESALIDPDNLLIALNHIKCSAYEIPFEDSDYYGNFSHTQTMELLDFLQQSGTLHHSQNKYFWMKDSYPAAGFSLRTTTNQQVTLKLISSAGEINVLGVVDRDSAYWMVHPGAIYLHQGDIFHVDSLNLETNIASLSPSTPVYFTEPERQTSFAVDKLLEKSCLGTADKFLGEITVTTQVSGYKKIRWSQYEVIGRESLDLPSTSLKTTGFWITLSSETETALRKVKLWTSSPNEYGPNWPSLREIILRRDKNTCQICGKSGDIVPLHIHHKKPLRSFSSFEEANQIDNLVTLCFRCHNRAEAVVRVNSGLRGLGYALHSLSPLFLMCDPGDLGVHTDCNSPLGDGRPVVLLHEQIPAGIGFSKNLYDREKELLDTAFELVRVCPCREGCPSCVGPGGEKGYGGKMETLAILEILCA
ncbi:MAG: DEAD/DEAH box helicase [Anaerolineales bacterium]|nr:DEAD/DEAH box helicase [Anaerolineales bacterium]